jgi:hypothetical protein
MRKRWRDDEERVSGRMRRKSIITRVSVGEVELGMHAVRELTTCRIERRDAAPNQQHWHYPANFEGSEAVSRSVLSECVRQSSTPSY